MKKAIFMIAIIVIVILTLSDINNLEKNIYEENASLQVNNEIQDNTLSRNDEEQKENNALEATEENRETSVFTSEFIPQDVLQKMIGNSIPEKSKDKVNIDELSYLRITYWGFDEKSHVGEMVVNRKLANDVLDIFKEVYEKKYPIEKMKLIDEYGANDEKSMADNNTSAFCYRVVANTNTLSNHSKGASIDINPLYNPYISGKIISPTNAKKYTDRSINEKGVIKKGDELYNAFIKRGWTWGGEWKSKKDYQHFEKKI